MSGSSGVGDAVIKGVVGAVVTALLAWLTPVGAWLASTAKALWLHLGEASTWPNWIPYLLAVISVHSIVSRAIRWSRTTSTTYERFTQFTFLGATWRWNFIAGVPRSPWAFCPRCDGALVYEETGSRYYSDRPEDGPHVVLHCEHCNAQVLRQQGSKEYLVGRVLREIDRQIRTGEWKRHVPGATDASP